jgi:hypothetical protein
VLAAVAAEPVVAAAGAAAAAGLPKPSSRKADIMACTKRFSRPAGRRASQDLSSAGTGGVLGSATAAGLAGAYVFTNAKDRVVIDMMNSFSPGAWRISVRRVDERLVG